MSLYNILNAPMVYKLSQFLLAPGAGLMTRLRIRQLLNEYPSGSDVLDVGCGPASMLWRAGIYPAGLDMNPAYVAAFNAASERKCQLGSSDQLPFDDESFDSVWCFGLLHHMEDGPARQTIREMVRVCRRSGVVIVMDAVLPEPGWLRPVAYAVRRLDRGAFMRRQKTFDELMPALGGWTRRRVTYSLTGLESVINVLKR